MNCPICHTPMELVDYIDAHEGFTLVWMKGWQCSRCGYSLNQLGEFNRRFMTFDVWPCETVQDVTPSEECLGPPEHPSFRDTPFRSGQEDAQLVGFL